MVSWAGFPWPGHCPPGTSRYHSSTTLETAHIHMVPSKPWNTHDVSSVPLQLCYQSQPKHQCPSVKPFSSKASSHGTTNRLTLLCLIKAHQGGLLSERLWRAAQSTGVASRARLFRFSNSSFQPGSFLSMQRSSHSYEWKGTRKTT